MHILRTEFDKPKSATIFQISASKAEFKAATRKERPCFAAERGLDRRGHRSLRMI